MRIAQGWSGSWVPHRAVNNNNNNNNNNNINNNSTFEKEYFVIFKMKWPLYDGFGTLYLPLTHFPLSLMRVNGRQVGTGLTAAADRLVQDWQQPQTGWYRTDSSRRQVGTGLTAAADRLVQDWQQPQTGWYRTDSSRRQVGTGLTAAADRLVQDWQQPQTGWYRTDSSRRKEQMCRRICRIIRTSQRLSWLNYRRRKYIGRVGRKN